MKNTDDKRNGILKESIQSSYDSCNGDPAFIIANLETDDAWLSISIGDEIPVAEWR